VVHDVWELGESYVTCDPRDRSEVVVPLIDKDGSCWAVLDLDSHEVGAFTEADAQGLTSALRAAGLAQK
jgi:GAF domain-containing protein